MQGSALYHNGQHVQRRKMFSLGQRHNLKSNPHLYWLGSMQFGNPDPHKLYTQRRQPSPQIRRNSPEIIRNSANQYLESNPSRVYGPSSEEQSKARNPQQNISHSYSPSPQLKTIDPSLNRKEDILSKEVKKFDMNNGSGIYSRRLKSIDEIPVSRIHYDSRQKKLNNLRSSLDKPVYENPSIFQNQSELFKSKGGNDKLEDFLRIGLKKSSRYY